MIAHLAVVNIVLVSMCFHRRFLQLELILGLQVPSEDLAFSKDVATFSLRNKHPFGNLELPEKKLFIPGQSRAPRGLPEFSIPHHGVAQTLAMNLNLSCKTEVFQDPGTQRCKKGQLNL